MKKEFIFAHNQFIEADNPVIFNNDRGLAFGDGIFETMLTHKSKIPFFDQHWQRLINGTKYLGINFIDHTDYNKNYIYQIIKELLTLNHDANSTAGVKIIVTRGTQPVANRSLEPLNNYNYQPSLIICSFDTDLFTLKSKTLEVVGETHFVNPSSLLTKVKSLNYLDKILAKNIAIENNFDDALLINFDYQICEATTSNIFFVDNLNNILTPKLSDGVLPGITRNYVITTLRKLGFNVIEQSITYSLDNIKEAFITNSIIGINSVSRINNLYFTSDYFANIVLNNLVNLFESVATKELI